MLSDSTSELAECGRVGRGMFPPCARSSSLEPSRTPYCCLRDCLRSLSDGRSAIAVSNPIPERTDFSSFSSKRSLR